MKRVGGGTGSDGVDREKRKLKAYRLRKAQKTEHFWLLGGMGWQGKLAKVAVIGAGSGGLWYALDSRVIEDAPPPKVGANAPTAVVPS